MQCEIRRRGVAFGLGDDDVTVIEVVGRAVPQGPLNVLRREWRTDATSVAGRQESVPAHDVGRGVARDEPPLGLVDIPLIVEDLLVQTRSLAESGAPSEAIEAILDHVASLREGRG